MKNKFNGIKTMNSLKKIYHNSIPRYYKKKVVNESKLLNLMHFGYPIIFKNNFKISNRSALYSLVEGLGPDLTVSVRHGNFANPKEYSFKRKIKEMTLRDFFENYFLKNQRETHYLGNYSITTEQLKKINIKAPNIYNPFTFVGVSQLWIGRKGCITPLHCDGADNFIYQLYGEKKWIVFPPNDFKKLNVNKDAGLPTAGFFCSDLNLKKKEDLKMLSQKTSPLSITVRAGESLYMPCGWFHYVETKKNSIAINFWVNNTNASPAVIKNRLKFKSKKGFYE